MPNIIDFDILKDIKRILVRPKGWIEPLYVEYGFGLHNITTPSYFWRIKDTKHTFIIPISRFHYLARGDYEKHFNEVLEKFREDYLGWKEKNFDEADWQKDYKKEYSKFISV